MLYYPSMFKFSAYFKLQTLSSVTDGILQLFPLMNAFPISMHISLCFTLVYVFFLGCRSNLALCDWNFFFFTCWRDMEHAVHMRSEYKWVKAHFMIMLKMKCAEVRVEAPSQFPWTVGVWNNGSSVASAPHLCSPADRHINAIGQRFILIMLRWFWKWDPSCFLNLEP